MTTYTKHMELLRVHVSDNWEETDIAWPNVNYKPEEQTPFVRYSVQDGDRLQASTGGETNVFRQVGVLFLQVFTPAGKGEGHGIDLAASLAAIFDDVDELGSGLHFRQPPSIKRIGVDGARFQVNVVVPFESETFQ